ncbi:MAG TPA: LAGLIDADG family homing endonuclease [Trueperaceae bacterium]
MRPARFGDHAVKVARRQYFQPGDETVYDMFERVARWVARPEPEERRDDVAAEFYRLMAEQRFCPGGRVLAGAATEHGNVLNCFVQDGSPEPEGTNAWVLRLATKLALVTKVGGGNGLNLDPIPPKRRFDGKVGRLYLTVDSSHPDYEAIRTGTFLDLVRDQMVTKGYRVATFVEKGEAPAGAELVEVPDSVEGIWESAGRAAMGLLAGRDVLVDLSLLRPVGTPVRGSGGASSGPSSFAVEIFDNFAIWAGLGGADHAGPVATLRYVFAPTLRAIRQGGCLHPETLVHTSKGTLRLEEIVDAQQLGWQDHHLQVATDQGWKASPRGFNNGVARTLRVTLENGQTLRGTPNHKVKVLRRDASREWVEFQHLQKGDFVIQVLDQHTGAPVVLRPVDAPHHNAKPIRMPEVLDERLAFFLGFLWGDGYVSSGRVGLAVAHGSPMIEVAPRLFAELFGLGVATEQKEGDASLVYVTKSAQLVAWLKANGLAKGKAKELAVPKAVRMSPRPVVGAFLRGLFEADGSLAHGMPVLSTASARLADDVATLLAGLGIPTRTRTVGARPDRYSTHASHHVRVVSHKGLERYCERVGFLAGSRLEAAKEHVPDEAPEQSWVFPHAAALMSTVLDAMPAGAEGRPSPYAATRKSLLRYARDERHPTATGYERQSASPQLQDVLPELGYDEHYVRVVGVEEAGRSLTLDLSVDENKTYLAGGFVTHNTRRGAGMATISITHPDVHDFITAKDLERERDEGDISTFNISVLVTDDFMRRESQSRGGVLWEIAQHAWATGEPGLIYIDRINEHNAMRTALGDIKSTNPCGEIPLYPGEPCDLGAVNLAAYVVRSGVGLEGFDMEAFRRDVATCVRFLDDVLDVNRFALPDNREMSMKLRRLGLGVMGLADALIKMGYPYNTDEGRSAVETIISALRDAATEASERLAEERGAFPLVGQADLPQPRRNVAILTVAPTGTTSMLMGVSSGVEPVFAPFIYRKIGASYHALIHPLFRELLEAHQPPRGYAKDGQWDWDAVVKAVQDNHGSVQGLDFIPEAVRRVLICAHDITPADHVRMQATVQRAFDGGKKVANSISKTINLPNSATVDDVFDAYRLAFETGCKGITVYRDGSREFQVLSTSAEKKEPAPQPAGQPEAPRPDAAAADGAAQAGGAAQSPAPPAGAAVANGQPAASTGARTETAVSVAPPPEGPSAPARRGGYDRLPGEPLFERPVRLSGFTDQVKLIEPSGEKRGFYVTVNKQDGLPTEVFILSGKGGDEANADSEALGRVVSIALQYGVPAEAIVKTLRGINGGMYGTYHGRMVASKADIIAVALETAGVENVLNRGKACPDCGAPLRFEEGCQKCESCGYSKCG